MKSFQLKIVLSVVWVALIAGCGSKDSVTTGELAGTDSATIPDSELSGATIYLYNRGRVTAEITADKIIKFDISDSTVAFNLSIDAFDSLGNLSTHLVGDSGIIRELSGQMDIYGNVVVITHDSSKLETEYLYWDSEANLIKTDLFVKITKKTDVITGIGLETDQNLQRIKILQQVSGTLSDTKKLTE